jgi:predicted Zn-dependent protease with MMP-like domain
MVPPNELSPAQADALEHLLTDFEQQLNDKNLDTAAELLAEAREFAGTDHPEVVYAEALLAWEQQGPVAAEPILARALKLDPDHADAHHALAIVCELEGERERMIEHFVAVRRLDAAADGKAGLGSRSDFDFMERIAQEVLAGVPEEFRERLEDVPIVLEPRPSEGIVREGFDPRAFGLFEGLEEAHSDHLALAPTRIVLFCSNLLAAFPHEEDLAEQIEITILHEVGHFFGLDEDDVARLGLE